MAQAFEIKAAGVLKFFESDFHLDGAEVSNEMKRILGNCNSGSRHKFANSEAMSSSRPDDDSKIDAIDALSSETLPDGEELTDSPGSANRGREESSAA